MRSYDQITIKCNLNCTKYENKTIHSALGIGRSFSLYLVVVQEKLIYFNHGKFNAWSSDSGSK